MGELSHIKPPPSERVSPPSKHTISLPISLVLGQIVIAFSFYSLGQLKSVFVGLFISIASFLRHFQSCYTESS